MALTQVSTGGIKDGQVQTADLADGQVTVGKLHADALDHTYTLGASGTDHYTFTGEGLTGAVNDPTLYLTRGKTYRFVNGNSAGAHPFRIQTTVNGSAGTEYNTGVTNNGGAGGSTIVFEVPHGAPDVLYYQCTSHGSMGGILYVTGALADGTVTTAKLADDAVTDAKLANSINSAIAANTAKVQTTINNNADNRVITGSGTANTLNAESDVVIDSSGNLGIGAGTPRQKLHISASDSSSANMVFTNSTTGTSAGDGFIVGITGGEDAQLNMQESANLKFSTADTERMRITSDGKVGIGTDSPDFEFQVEDSSGAAVIRAKNGSNNYICDLIVDGTGGLVRTVGSQPLRFDTNQVERMRIDESGIVTKPYQPSFHANSGSTYWTHGSSTGTLDIDTVTTELFDVGGNYNASTCVFTAPVAGKYFFTFTYAYVCTSGYLNIHLKKGVSGTYSTYGKMFASPPQQSSAYSGPPVTGIIELAAGNTVKPMAELNYAGNQLVNVSFTGYLIG
jgi:hypothetical protein